MALIAGIVIGRFLPITRPKLKNGTVPLATIISEFREFSKGIEGGVLTKETDEACRMLESIANGTKRKCLPITKSVKREPMTPGKGEWGEQKCLERELSRASDDDERLQVFAEWLCKYSFAKSWQVWSLEKMTTASGRADLRNLFRECES